MRAAVSVWCILLCSCAVAFGKRPRDILVGSNPQGALITYQGTEVARTPATIRVRHGAPLLTLHLDGHHPREVNVGLVSNADLIVFGSFMWGPFELLGAAMADAWYRLDGKPVMADLAPIDSAALPKWERPVARKPANDLGTIGK